MPRNSRRFASFAALVCATLVMAGCTSAPTPTPSPSDIPPTVPATPTDVRVAALNGPTAMGMAKMVTDSRAGANPEADTNNYEFTLVSAPDEIVAKIVSGEVDIAAIPANLASVLYNKLDSDLQVLTINTLGVLSIVGAHPTRDSTLSIADLKGRTLCAAGKGAVPEYTLTYVLTENGLDITKDVDIQWVPEHGACLALLTENVETLAMLPQPFVTAASAKVPDLAVLIDLNDAWEQVNPSQMLTGVTVVRKAFAEAHPEAIAAFLNTYTASVDFTRDDIKTAAALIGDLKIVDAGIAEVALPHCNIVFITCGDMKDNLSGFLAVLEGITPASIGGTLPGADFYYGA